MAKLIYFAILEKNNWSNIYNNEPVDKADEQRYKSRIALLAYLDMRTRSNNPLELLNESTTSITIGR